MPPPTIMMRTPPAYYGIIVAVALAAIAPAFAVSVDELEVTHEADTYRVHFDVRMEADAARVRALLSDYRHWPRISQTIKESRLVRDWPDGRKRVSADLRSCVAFILCKTVRQVKDLQPPAADGVFRTDMVAGEGDFASGWEIWEIVDAGVRRTRLRYRAQLVPAFGLPPLVGPWLLKRELRAELLRTADAVEKLAGR
jgi:hypothetical protein